LTPPPEVLQMHDCVPALEVLEPPRGYRLQTTAIILLTAAYGPVCAMCLLAPTAILRAPEYLPVVPFCLAFVLVEGGFRLLLSSGFAAVLALGHVLSICLLIASAVSRRGRFHKGLVCAVALMTLWISIGSTLFFVGLIYAGSA
jgi:hypothetical protein